MFRFCKQIFLLKPNNCPFFIQQKEFPKQVEVVGKKVRVLDGSGNKITIIPDYIDVMTFCNRLALSQNRITEIPRTVGYLQNLRVLLLDGNRIRTLPRQLFKLSKLERLNLSNNYLTEIPSGISKLKSLKYLEFCSNKLVSLPREIGELSNLEELHCSDNALARLPVDLAKLERLRAIIAEKNMIDSIPTEILLYCENLQTIGLHSNPLTLDTLQQTKGYAEFEARRKLKWDKSIAAGVLLGGNHFDEGVDRSIKSSVGGKLDREDTPPLLDTPENGKKKRSKKKRRSSGIKAHEVSVDAGTSP